MTHNQLWSVADLLLWFEQYKSEWQKHQPHGEQTSTYKCSLSLQPEFRIDSIVE